MAAESGYVVRAAQDADIEAAVEVQHRAFRRVARTLSLEPCAMPPIQETASDVRALLAEHPDALLFVAVATAEGAPAGSAPGAVVGTVRGIPGANETVEVGRLAVEDGWERRGMGRALMEALEASFPAAGRFELFTGRDAVGPLALYRGLGYTDMGEAEWAEATHLVWLEKCRSNTTGS